MRSAFIVAQGATLSGEILASETGDIGSNATLRAVVYTTGTGSGAAPVPPDLTATVGRADESRYIVSISAANTARLLGDYVVDFLADDARGIRRIHRADLTVLATPINLPAHSEPVEPDAIIFYAGATATDATPALADLTRIEASALTTIEISATIAGGSVWIITPLAHPLTALVNPTFHNDALAAFTHATENIGGTTYNTYTITDTNAGLDLRYQAHIAQ